MATCVSKPFKDLKGLKKTQKELQTLESTAVLCAILTSKSHFEAEPDGECPGALDDLTLLPLPLVFVLGLVKDIPESS